MSKSAPSSIDLTEKKTPLLLQRDSFFGRRYGPSLRIQQKQLLENLLPKLTLDITKPCSSLEEIFLRKKDKTFQPFILEIGFGGGEHLYHALQREQDAFFIGVEPFVNSMVKLLKSVHGTNYIDRLKLFDDDAALLLDWLPENSLDRIDMFYPDPWPKKKHWKRRFIQHKNLQRFARVLKPKGILRFASDIDHYINWTLFHMAQHASFEWCCGEIKSWQKPYKDWVLTRYEAKALAAQRTPSYLTFERL